MPRLVIRKKNRKRARTASIECSPFTIGRSSANDLVLHDLSVSRHHCVIEMEADIAHVRDLGSSHGIKVNHEPAARRRLEHKDVIRIGPYRLTFVADAKTTSNDSPDEMTPERRESRKSTTDRSKRKRRRQTREHKIADRTAEINQLRTEIERLRELTNAAESRAQATERERDSMDEKAKRGENERLMMADQLREAEEALDDAQSRHRDLENEVLVSHAMRDRLAAALEAMMHASDSLMERSDRLEAAIKEQRGENEALAEALHKAQSAREAAESARTALSEKIEKLRRQLRQTGEERDRLSERIASLETADANRIDALERFRLTASRLEQTRRQLAATQARLRDYESIIQASLLDADGAEDLTELETRVVEMTPAELADARARGATILEIDLPRPRA